MVADLRTILRELRQSLESFYPSRLRQVVLFGSQARSDADVGLDIDVLVVLDGPVNPGEEIMRTSAAIAELSLRHDTVISCLFISAERYASEQSPLLLNVRREGVAA